MRRLKRLCGGSSSPFKKHIGLTVATAQVLQGQHDGPGQHMQRFSQAGNASKMQSSQCSMVLLEDIAGTTEMSWQGLHLRAARAFSELSPVASLSSMRAKGAPDPSRASLRLCAQLPAITQELCAEHAY